MPTMDTMAMPVPMLMAMPGTAMDLEDTDTLARGLLMLSLLLMPMLTTDTTDMPVPMPTVIPDILEDTDTLARGLLMPSPRLMPMPTTTAMDMLDTPIPTDTL